MVALRQGGVLARWGGGGALDMEGNRSHKGLACQVGLDMLHRLYPHRQHENRVHLSRQADGAG